jgi:ABC-2 type transport system permease protein
MIKMKELFNSRLQTHLNNLLRYSRYVFNDFFVIALMFFIGGLGYEYSIMLKHLSINAWWERPLVIVIFTLGLQLGKLITLVHPADYIFWLPQDVAFFSFFKRGLHYSEWIASGIQITIWVIMMPFLAKTTIITSSFNFIGLLLLLIGLKIMWLNLDLLRNYRLSGYIALVEHWILPLIIISLGIYVSVWLALIVVIILLLAVYHRLKSAVNRPVDWSRIIKNENDHVNRLNHLFNMFMDVHNLQSKVKRRKYLDFILKYFNQTAFHILYSRGIMRSQEVSGIMLRLSLIGAVILAAVTQPILAAIIGTLFMYLIIFQLIPFFKHFDDNILVVIYPVSTKQRELAFQTNLFYFLLPTILCFMVGVLISQGFMMMCIFMLGWLLEGWLLIKFYVPIKVEKARLN